MISIELNKHSNEDFLEIEKLRKEGIPDDIIQLAYNNTMNARKDGNDTEDNR